MQFAISYDNKQETLLWQHVSYRPTLEAVDGSKEIETSVIMLTAIAYSIVNFVGQAQQTKGPGGTSI